MHNNLFNYSTRKHQSDKTEYLYKENKGIINLDKIVILLEKVGEVAVIPYPCYARVSFLAASFEGGFVV